MLVARVSQRSWQVLVGSLGLMVCSGGALLAQQVTRVQFDAPYTIAARELPSSPGMLESGEKLVETRVDISSMITSGSERDVTQFVFQLQSMQRTMQVFDYLPRSARDTAIVGKVAISEGNEDSTSLGLDLTGQYQNLTSATAQFGQKTSENEGRKFERLPALETVVASGTLYRGTGAYFKLHTTDRQLLEGSTMVSILWRVPTHWRADYVHLRCVAEGRGREGIQRVGQRDFLVPLYLAGDQQAQQTAVEFARAEASLRMTARQHVQQIVNKPQLPWGRGLPLLIGDNEQSIPHDWLERLLYIPSTTNIPSRLPAAVKTAASDYTLVRQQLAAYSGWQPAANEQASNQLQPVVGR